MRTTLRVAAAVLLATTGLLAADAPYVGKWKLNVSKSDFGQLTIVYEAQPGGGFKTTMDGLSFTFKLDGKEFPTPWGETTAWKAVNATTWEFTNRANGKIVSTNVVKVSADGKSMQTESNMTNPNGPPSIVNMTFQRVSGGPGLAGTWKAAKLSSNSPTAIEIVAKGTDGLVFKYVDQGGQCDGRLDGKDHPASGSIWPSGWTCVMTKSGDRGFDITWKKDGKAMYKSTYVASADGKTLIENGGSANTTERVKAVYDRQ